MGFFDSLFGPEQYGPPAPGGNMGQLAAAAPFISSLGGLFGGGGGKTEVRQSSSNSTSVNLSTILSNQSPGSQTAPSSGGAASSSTNGPEAPALPVSPYAYPYEGVGSQQAATTIQNGAAGNETATGRKDYFTVAILLAAMAGAVFFLTKKR